MRAVLPGKPAPATQAVCTAYWGGTRLIAYITGNAFVILTGLHSLLQTVYDESDKQLEAIAIDEATGKIAVCAETTIRVYRPYGQDENALRWSLQYSFVLHKLSTDTTITLSWGVAEELLVGSDLLTLYSTLDTPEIIWQQKLANPVRCAEFSYDSEFIASNDWYSRFIKIWKRLSFGSEDTRFDFSYLSHPATVTDIRWRKPYHVDHTMDNVCYSTCADQILRIWVASNPHDHDTRHMQLWGQIDIKESIQPRALSEPSNIRFSFIIDGRDFMLAMEHAVQFSKVIDNAENHALSHLIEVASRNPEVCVILDDVGHMSAWGLEAISYKTRLKKNIFNIAHVDGLNLILPNEFQVASSQVRCYNYGNKSDGGLTVLFHIFDGRIEVLESNVANLFDPLSRSDRFITKTRWTGHSASVNKIVRDVSGKAIVSRTHNNECMVWQHLDIQGGASILLQSIITEKNHIHRICVVKKGQFVIFLHHDRVSLWDARRSEGYLLASSSYFVAGKPLCILMLPETQREFPIIHFATITSRMKGIVWAARLPLNNKASETNGYHDCSIDEFCRFDLGNLDSLSYILPIDSSDSYPVLSGFLDTFARDVAISYTHSGMLRAWTASVDIAKNRVNWSQTCSVNTGISDAALVSGNSRRKAALVNSTQSKLTIWDIRGAQLEYSQNYEFQDTVQDLDWTSTPDYQSILAVGFPFRITLLAQARYDYINQCSAWVSIREISIRDYTPHPIGDSTWLSCGDLIVGAGNQLFIFDRQVDSSASVIRDLGLPSSQPHWDIFDVVTQLNGPLPVYHPQFLAQCTLAFKVTLVQRVILRLYKTLKYFVEGESIDNYLNINLEDFYARDTIKPTGTIHRVINNFGNFSDEEDEESVTENVASFITEKLRQICLPQLSKQEQIHLADIIESVAAVEKRRQSMDVNAATFMFFFRQYILHRGRENEVCLSWREINWAYHSNSQEILVDLVSRQFQGKMTWKHARESGIFMWMTDPTALKSQFEHIARNEYTKTDMKNPVDCTLFYLALRKKNVLQGLWRMAAWNHEQAATIRFLSNNFQDKKWKTAAMKNAYALLGKHRYEYAAAFFLLADCLKDAVNVILNQLKDLQLAITVARVYEGDTGSVLKGLLEEKVLPLASREGNRWLASWTFWMLQRKDMSVRALMSPTYARFESSSNPDLQAKLFLTDDPALLTLYCQLRKRTIQTFHGASKITPKVEWAFILHNARLYHRMGCNLLALDLVCNWEFLDPVPSAIFENPRRRNPRSMLRGCSSLIITDLPEPYLPLDMKTGGHEPPPSVFEEPESSSLLDSFGL